MIEFLSEIQDGQIILIDKPWGWTSFHVVKTIKKYIHNIHRIKKVLKIGHAGTLDPLATGLLIILIGPCTKKMNIIQNYKKCYTGIIKLGCETSSYDSETEEYNFSSFSHITPKLIQETSNQFIGRIQQYPPYFSALKKKGKKFYEYSRNGEKMDFIQSRCIEIDKFHILKISIPYIKFFIQCGKGTYIRSIAKDFGIALESRSYLLSLRRESIGHFSINSSYNINQIIHFLVNKKKL
ncbi:tRNA pseudouridine(55) synthase TruB [Blattabacterium cuenoti]|uniref:tRNA pseudouridine(55) synthase TruB n=1 Tax=Blattabacterium cuenoti TaxID=1653831 RepID=UPI001EE9CE8A|nr:tRNA pseudouridine(55) synthase TruB [Blattabacterium cuenoti]